MLSPVKATTHATGPSRGGKHKVPVTRDQRFMQLGTLNLARTKVPHRRPGLLRHDSGRLEPWHGGKPSAELEECARD